MKGQYVSKIEEPRFAKTFRTVTADVIIREDDSYIDCMMEKCNVSGESQSLIISRTVFRGVHFKAALPSAEFEDVLFDGCDLSNMNLSDSNLQRVVFINCRMVGTDFSGSILKDIVFENSLLKYSNFRFTRFTHAAFRQCSCANSDFQKSAFKNLEFCDTDLRLSQMSGTSLENINLTTCEIDGLGVRPEDLRGAVFSPDQAVTAAKIIGIVIQY